MKTVWRWTKEGALWSKVLMLAGFFYAFLLAGVSLAEVSVPKPSLPFVENLGQFPEPIRFVGSDRNCSLAVTSRTLSYRLNREGQTLTEFAVGAEPFTPSGLNQAVTRVHDFRGNSSKTWRSNLPSYLSVRLGEVYPGVLMRLQFNPTGIEKIFELQPGAEVSTIGLDFEQPHSMQVETDGSLQVSLQDSEGSVRFSPPVAYQEIGKERTKVPVSYRLLPDGGYGFTVAHYRQDYPLVIDPSLIASTLIGGDGYDDASKVLVDKNGNVVVAGNTSVLYSSQPEAFRTVSGGYDNTLQGGEGTYDVYVARFDPELKQMLDMTFLGSTASDYTHALKMAADGSFYLAGFTSYNPNFPTTEGAYQRSGPRNSGAFVSHLSADLSSLVASTVFDVGPWTWLDLYDLALDADGNVFLAGGIHGGGLPDKGGYDPSTNIWSDALIVKFNGALTELTGATHLGGVAAEQARAIAVDSSGRVYVTGEVANSQSPQAGGLQYDFPTTAGSWMPTATGCSASFVSRFNNALTQLESSTFLGVTGSSEVRCGYSDSYGTVNTKDLVLDAEGRVYVTGIVDSTGLPVTGGYQPFFYKRNGFHFNQPFIARLDSELSKIDALTHFGGADWYDTPVELALDADGNVVLAGSAGSKDFPTTIDAYETRLNKGVYGYDTYDAFFAMFSPDLTRLAYSTVIGGTRGDTLYGVAVSPDNDIYLIGQTQGVWDPPQNFPTTTDAFDSTLPDWGWDGFVARLQVPEILSVAISGTQRMVPGTEADFVVTYRNTMRVAAENAVVLIDLPAGFEFAGGSDGGQFYADGQCSNQMFWVLGELPSGSEDTLRFRLRVPAGAPSNDYSMMARISASNDPAPSFDVTPYLSYQGVEVSSTSYLSTAEIDAALLANSALKGMYQYALTNGYAFSGTATRVDFSDGQQAWRLYLVSKADGAMAILTALNDQAFVEVHRGSQYTLFDQDGGFTRNSSLGSLEYFGNWSTQEVQSSSIERNTLFSQQEMGASSLASPSLFSRRGRCNFNCMINLIPDMTLGKISQLYSMLSMSIECIKCAQAVKNGKTDETSVLENCSKCGTAAAEMVDAERVVSKIPGIGDAATVVLKLRECVKDCTENPNLHVCTQDRFDCSCFGNWVLGGVCRTECNTTTGTFAPLSKTLFCTANEVCQASSCNDTGYESCCVNEKSVCPDGKNCNQKNVQARASHDPNAKEADKSGAIQAGTLVRFTLQYENTGSGDALGVFVLDNLSDMYDDTTLQIEDGGQYNSDIRLLQWNIGDLTPGQQGEVHFTVALRQDLAEGAEVTNQAEVYFPNALEITPTNVVLHVVHSIAAQDQTLAVTAGEPALITLTGQGPGELTYQLMSEPLNGSLTGTSPNLYYTGASGFSGVDRFTFRVVSGDLASAPASVTLEVAPDPADITPPQVSSVSPLDGQEGVPYSSGEVADGYYAPVVEAVLSEDVDLSTVTAANFRINSVAGKVDYDAATRTARLWPASQLNAAQAYTVVIENVMDRSGNLMSQPFSWSFTTAEENPEANSPVLLVEMSGPGMISSAPAGIQCGSDCTESFVAGTAVTLTATPDLTSLGGDFPFLGWGGDCSGTVRTCTLTMDAVRTVTATFSYNGVGSAYARSWLQKAYVAYYGRPADPVGQGYWANRMDGEGGTLAAIINSFGTSDEFNRRYGGLGNTELVNRIYQQILGRDAEPAGLAYYVGLLESGRTTLQTITLDVLGGATGDDVTVVTNRILVADYYTTKVADGCSYGTEQIGVDTLAAVTGEVATVASGKAAIDARCAGE